MLRKTKTSTIRLQDCLNESVFLSHKAFKTKPKAKNAVAVIKSDIIAEVSLSAKDVTIGIIVSPPVICRTKPILAKIAFIVCSVNYIAA